MPWVVEASCALGVGLGNWLPGPLDTTLGEPPGGTTGPFDTELTGRDAGETLGPEELAPAGKGPPTGGGVGSAPNAPAAELVQSAPEEVCSLAAEPGGTNPARPVPEEIEPDPDGSAEPAPPELPELDAPPDPVAEPPGLAGAATSRAPPGPDASRPVAEPPEPDEAASLEPPEVDPLPSWLAPVDPPGPAASREPLEPDAPFSPPDPDGAASREPPELVAPPAPPEPVSREGGLPADSRSAGRVAMPDSCGPAGGATLVPAQRGCGGLEDSSSWRA